MDTKRVRKIYIDMLTLYITKVNIASPSNDRLQDELCKFETNPEYRLPLNKHTIDILDIVCTRENLSPDEARWCRDTWLY